MGNDFNLTKSCVGASQLCTQEFNVQQVHQQTYTLKKKKLKSTEEIKQKILKYIEKNRLQLYSVRQKKVLETLVSVDQQHVSDRIVQMDKRLRILQQQKRQLSRKDKNKQQQNTKEQDKKISEEVNKKTQKLFQVTQELFKLKQKRKKLFEQAQCLLLQDLDMILQQMQNFDNNYHFVNQVINQRHVLAKKQENIENKSQMQKTNTKSFNKSTIQNFYSASKLKASTIYQENQTKFSSVKNKMLHPLENRKQKRYYEKLKQALRTEDKKALKRRPQISRLGAQILKENQLLMVVPIQCFNGIGALQKNNKTGLPSGASLLQILANKIKAVNMRRGCSLGLAFLVNDQYVQKFKEEISKTIGFENYDCDRVEISSNLQNLTDANSQPISYHVIPFRDIWPSYDSQNKIILNSQEEGGINFSSRDGDLIGFIQNSMQLKDLIQNYQYINFTNISNLLSQIGDVYALGYLSMNQQLDIVTKILKPQNSSYELKDYFELDEKGFINILQKQININQNEKQKPLIQSQKIYTKNSSFLNTQEYYIRSRIFTTQSGPLKRLLMSRISRCLDLNSDSQSLKFYLHRSLSSIFFYKFSAFLLIDEENEFSHVKSQSKFFHTNGEIGYSRYCKKLLGLNQIQKNKQFQEMVEIDAGILHKGSEQMMKILKELRKVKEVGFPIILYSNFFNNSKQT